MKCPRCLAFNNSKVLDSRPKENNIYRRRKCLECGQRWTTFELSFKEIRDFYEDIIHDLKDSIVKMERFLQHHPYKEKE